MHDWGSKSAMLSVLAMGIAGTNLFAARELSAEELAAGEHAAEESQTGAESATQGEETSTDDGDDAPEKKRRHKLAIGFDGSVLAGVNRSGGDVGGAFDLRLGSHRTLGHILAFRPEFGIGYNNLASQDVGRVYGGARVGVQFLVGIYAYGHAGFAWGGDSTGFAGDVGLAVDMLLWIFRPGIHVDYMGVVDGIKAVRTGLHLDLVF